MVGLGGREGDIVRYACGFALPGDGGIIACGGHCQVGGLQASRKGGHLYVVYQDISVSDVTVLDGDIIAGAGIVVQPHRVAAISGIAVGNLNFFNLFEGKQIVRVGHHADG